MKVLLPQGFLNNLDYLPYLAELLEYLSFISGKQKIASCMTAKLL